MAHKYNLYYAMIFKKEELDHRAMHVVLHLQFCADNIIVSAIFYFLKIEKPNSWYNFSVEVRLIVPVIDKAALY